MAFDFEKYASVLPVVKQRAGSMELIRGSVSSGVGRGWAIQIMRVLRFQNWDVSVLRSSGLSEAFPMRAWAKGRMRTGRQGSKASCASTGGLILVPVKITRPRPLCARVQPKVKSPRGNPEKCPVLSGVRSCDSEKQSVIGRECEPLPLSAPPAQLGLETVNTVLVLGNTGFSIPLPYVRWVVLTSLTAYMSIQVDFYANVLTLYMRGLSTPRFLCLLGVLEWVLHVAFFDVHLTQDYHKFLSHLFI